MAIDVVAAAHRTARRSRDIAMDFDCRLRFPRAPERMDKKDGRGIYMFPRGMKVNTHPTQHDTARVMTSLQVIMNCVVPWRKSRLHTY